MKNVDTKVQKIKNFYESEIQKSIKETGREKRKILRSICKQSVKCTGKYRIFEKKKKEKHKVKPTKEN